MGGQPSFFWQYRSVTIMETKSKRLPPATLRAIASESVGPQEISRIRIWYTSRA